MYDQNLTMALLCSDKWAEHILVTISNSVIPFHSIPFTSSLVSWFQTCRSGVRWRGGDPIIQKVGAVSVLWPSTETCCTLEATMPPKSVTMQTSLFSIPVSETGHTSVCVSDLMSEVCCSCFIRHMGMLRDSTFWRCPAPL